MSPSERTRVAIVGAGLAGLAFAVALNALDSERKIAIDLYESALELSEIGAGIHMWPRTWEILKEIGMEDTLIPLFDHCPDLEPRVIFEARKADQKDGFKIIDIMKNGGALRIHRADLQRSLLEHLPLAGSGRQVNSTCTLHLSHKLVDYGFSVSSPASSPSGPLTLYFADKANRTCDILIGADGIKSTVRRLFLTRLPSPKKYEAFLDPVWTGSIAYRGLVDVEELRRVHPGHRALSHPGILYSGKEKHSVVYPVSGGKHINVVAVVHDESKQGTTWNGQSNQEVTQGELFDCFAGWEEELQAVISCIHRPTIWSLQTLNHLNTFARGRVFLLGDSAHAMSPHQGAGAAVGIEDAYILASLLTHTSTSNPHSAQQITRIADIYNTTRVPQAISWSRASYEQGHLYSLQAPGFERFAEGDDIPREMLVELFRAAERNWSWTTSDADVDRKRAIQLLLEETPRL